jgi:hypothetical protein
MMVHREALEDPDVDILDNVLHWEQGQFEGEEVDQAFQIAELMDLWDDAAFVMEDFILQQFSQGRELLSPVRLTAMLSYHAAISYDSPRTIFLQMPSLAMSTVTDPRLKSWGFYKPGSVHARDATRHAITFLRRSKENTRLRRTAWPALYAQSLEA